MPAHNVASGKAWEAAVTAARRDARPARLVLVVRDATGYAAVEHRIYGPTYFRWLYLTDGSDRTAPVPPEPTWTL
jgi:hypothetical protein